MKNKTKKSPFDGFSKLNLEQRLKRLITTKYINQIIVTQLLSHHLDHHLAENLIENAIGYYQIPLGVAVNFRIDEKDYVIPMAVEETSIIAAASKTAKWVKHNGKIITKTLGELAIGQIQIAKIKGDIDSFKCIIDSNKQDLISDANMHITESMIKRGGGVKDMNVRTFPRGDGYHMGIIHVMINTCDAMGANFINQICEYLRAPIEKITQEKVTMCILSNLNDRKLVHAEIIIEDIDPNLAEGIAEASMFAEFDPYRAATNNKGVMNGMDAVVVATGNDWRAVEAGVHAYAARDGKYRPITCWSKQGKALVGIIKAPINVGIVGGVTQNHPTAKISLQMLGVKTASELSRIIAAVGLIQNLGALRALTTEGIVKGHMKLHIANLCLAASASPQEIKKLKPKLEKQLIINKRISQSDVVILLNKLRQK